MRYFFTETSRNAKTGPMPVVTASRDTCPTSCPLMNNGCYAEAGPLRLHWNEVTNGNRGTDLDALCQRIAKLPKRQMWRYGQAGDLPGNDEEIDAVEFSKLVSANRGRPVIAFTHKPPTPTNLTILQEALANGFHVNLSADNLPEADTLADTGLNTVTVINKDFARRSRGREWMETLGSYKLRIKSLTRKTPAGRKVAICPATYADVRCIDCGACSVATPRNVIIGFPAHGTKRNVVSKNSEQ